MYRFLIFCLVLPISPQLFAHPSESPSIGDSADNGCDFAWETRELSVKPVPVPRLKLSNEISYLKSTGNGGTYFVDGTIEVNNLTEYEELRGAYSLWLSESQATKVRSELEGKGFARVSLKKILPKEISDLVGRFSECQGANCFNATLIATKFETELQFTPGKKMHEALKEGFRTLERGETLVPGDILVIEGEDSFGIPGISHSAVYLGKDVFFHKASRDKDTPYCFERFGGICKPYYRNKIRPNLKFFRRIRV